MRNLFLAILLVFGGLCFGQTGTVYCLTPVDFPTGGGVNDTVSLRGAQSGDTIFWFLEHTNPGIPTDTVAVEVLAGGGGSTTGLVDSVYAITPSATQFGFVVENIGEPNDTILYTFSTVDYSLVQNNFVTGGGDDSVQLILEGPVPANNDTAAFTISASGGGGGSFNVANTAFVDATHGNDGTGALEDISLPYATTSAATTAINAAAVAGDKWVMVLRPGTYTNQISAGIVGGIELEIRFEGASELNVDVDGPAIESTGGVSFVLTGNVNVTNANAGSSAMLINAVGLIIDPTNRGVLECTSCTANSALTIGGTVSVIRNTDITAGPAQKGIVLSSSGTDFYMQSSSLTGTKAGAFSGLIESSTDGKIWIYDSDITNTGNGFPLSLGGASDCDFRLYNSNVTSTTGARAISVSGTNATIEIRNSRIETGGSSGEALRTLSNNDVRAYHSYFVCSGGGSPISIRNTSTAADVFNMGSILTHAEDLSGGGSVIGEAFVVTASFR